MESTLICDVCVCVRITSVSIPAYKYIHGTLNKSIINFITACLFKLFVWKMRTKWEVKNKETKRKNFVCMFKHPLNSRERQTTNNKHYGECKARKKKMIDTHFACLPDQHTYSIFWRFFFRALHHFHVPKWWKTLWLYVCIVLEQKKMPVEVDTTMLFSLPNRLPAEMYEYYVETLGSSFRFEFSLSAAVAFCVDLF